MPEKLRAHPTKWQLRHGPRAWMVMCRWRLSAGPTIYIPMGMGEGSWGYGLYNCLNTITGARPTRALAIFHTYEAARTEILRTLKRARAYFRAKNPLRSTWPDWVNERQWCIVPMRWENPHK